MIRAQFRRVIRPTLIQKRNLNLHEFRSAQLLKDYGVPVPPGKVAFDPQEAEAAAKELNSEDLVVKAQALTGGRGKGHFDNGLKGGVKMITSPREAKMYAEEMIGHQLITKQSGAAGKLVSAVYIVKREFVRREAYFSILYDRELQKPIIVASSQGGMDIEGVAKDTPEEIHKFPIDLHEGVTPELADKIASVFSFSSKARKEAADAVQKMYKLFDERDCTLVEINPLAEGVDNKVYAMDAKLNFDDNAAFRQTEVFDWRDLTQENPAEVEAAKYGLNLIVLDGNVGCLVNGAGLAMATLDIIKLNGGNPANFLDCGGGATAESIEKAFRLILQDRNVTSILVNIFGGIVRCDSIAQGLIAVAHNMNLTVPIVARLQGTNFEKAQELINNSGLKIFSFSDLDEAANKVVALSNIVEQARKSDVQVSFELPL